MMKSLFLILCLITPFVDASNVIIVNPSNASEISMEDVKKIYLGKKGTFSNGDKAMPITLSEGEASRIAFNSSLLRKNENQYVAYWSKMVFTGNGIPPQEVKSMEEMKQLIAKNPSTIGFIDKSLVDDSVKIVEAF